MTKPNKKDEPKKARKTTIKVTGLLMLFVVVSIAFSTYVVFVGVDSWVMRGLLIPQAVFATVVAVKSFMK